MRQIRVPLIVCCILTCGCAAHPSQPSFPLRQPFDLRAGASAALSDGLKVTFDRVKSDSRCPLDVLCVRAGEAVIAVSLSRSASTQVARELSTAAGASEAGYLGYVIKLVALAPYPRSAQPIRPEDYVATLSVDSP